MVSQLSDPTLVPLDSSNPHALDATERFSRAVAQALALQQRANQQECHSAAPASETARYQWEANCLYKRH